MARPLPQHDEMDEVKTIRTIIFSFLEIFPEAHFFSGKYHRHLMDLKK